MIPILLILLMFLSGCAEGPKVPVVPSEAGSKPPGDILLTLSPAQEQTIGLTEEVATIRQVPSTVGLTGKVQAATPLLSHVYSLVSGQAMQVPVSLGEPIHPGQTLAVVRSDQVGQIETDLLQAMLQLDQDLKQAQVQLELSQKAYQREAKLFNARVSAKADVESAQAQYQKDQAALSGIKARRQATIQTYQARLSLYGLGGNVAQQVVITRHISPYTTIHASRNGILIERNINTGELVDPAKELFLIADLSTVWIVGNVFEQDIHAVKHGQPVDVKLNSLPNTSHMGIVDLVGAMLDPQTRTLDIRVEVPNPNMALKPNMFARMSILTGQRNVLAIPKTAIQQNGDHTYVYVPVAAHQYEERPVNVTMTDDPFVEVLSGLRPGEKVVSHGTLSLKGEALKADTHSQSTE